MLINGMPYKRVTPYASIGASTTILGIAEKVWSIKYGDFTCNLLNAFILIVSKLQICY